MPFPVFTSVLLRAPGWTEAPAGRRLPGDDFPQHHTEGEQVHLHNFITGGAAETMIRVTGRGVVCGQG